MNIDSVSILVPAFSIGAIIFQIPLWMMSDYFGRKKSLKIIMLSGFIIFLFASIYHSSFIGLLVCFTVAGMIVGSTFSLGISYMADLLPKDFITGREFVMWDVL
ncbi:MULTISPECIES: MFS transporter [Bacillus]|uniref:MFS transporter n=1 Tax=Bacillus TaxID=1386 RepID=UPI0002DE6819|nr:MULTISPECIES: MFS transporter [Bacillus]